MPLPVLRFRAVSAADAPTCAAWLLDENRGACPAAAKLAPALAGLIRREHIKGMLIESRAPGATNWTAAGLGLSGFVPPQTAAAIVAAPRPFFFVDLLSRSTQPDGSAFLTLGEIAAANAGAGLDLVLHYQQRNWNLADEHWRAVCVMAHDAYVVDHCGYRLRRALQEDWAREPDIYVATGYRALAEFELHAGPAPPNDRTRQPRRILYYADDAEVRQSPPGSTIAKVFQHVPPRCGFSASEQRILVFATRGMTDDTIAEALGLSLNSVKQSWRRIYERVERHAPFVLDPANGELAEGRRGPEKRRHVLAFLDTHPQELRPFSRQSAD